MALQLYISTCAGQSHVRLFSDCGIGHMIIWSLQSITFAHPLRLNHNQVDRDEDKVLSDHQCFCKFNALLPVSNAEMQVSITERTQYVELLLDLNVS